MQFKIEFRQFFEKEIKLLLKINNYCTTDIDEARLTDRQSGARFWNPHMETCWHTRSLR